MVRPKAQRLQPRIDLLVGGGKHRIFCGRIDVAVNGRIQPVVRRQVAPGVGGQHFKMHGLDFIQLGWCDSLRGQFARLRFQTGHDLKSVQHIGFAQQDGNGPPVGQQLNQPFGGQHLDGFAQRRARDIEHFTQFALIELGARRNAVFNQHLAQAVRHLLMQRGSGNGDDFSSHG